jgi:dTDP-4-dehydrorhamnose 3,5-epimerase
MIFSETKLKGAYVIDIQKLEDERGFFARSWCQREVEQYGLAPQVIQCNISYNKVHGTLRGMHYQLPPYTEAKLVRCTQGSIFDVIIDLRPQEPTFRKWQGFELSASNYKMIYIPRGFAHGFLTLENDTEVFYQMSEFYAPDYSRGVRWNDPLFGINWPHSVKCISQKDQSLPDAQPDDFEALAGMI